VHLTFELQRARERLVTAREEERRRLRRDLHDGLGPQLGSQTLTLTAVRKLLRRDPDAAEMLLADAMTHAEEAIKDIRRLVYDLRPPALDDLGLLGSLRETALQYSHNGLRVTVTAPPSLPALPAAVEVACYRIAREALANVARHAQAKSCTIRLWVNSALHLEVSDDGIGLPPAYRAGVGVVSMRERAEELGGSLVVTSAAGTTVQATIPLSPMHRGAPQQRPPGQATEEAAAGAAEVPA
jgi:signal transduction histidine kinase